MTKQDFFNKWIEIIRKTSANQIYKQEFLSLWLDIVRRSPVHNTYAVAWAKAITEIASKKNHNDESGQVEIPISRIAVKMINFYWNQTIFFNLLQGINPLQPPEIVSGVKDLIREFQKAQKSKQPVLFEKIDFDTTCRHKYRICLDRVIDKLKNDVAEKFLILEGKHLDSVYDYEKGADSLVMPVLNIATLRENRTIIIDAINYRWARILEIHNNSPRICKKVGIFDNEKPGKKLFSFSKYLDLENPGHICFYCGQPVEEDDLAIDHIIPWSYLCSDNIWNLVYAHSTCISAKLSIFPVEFTVAKLDKRNKTLLGVLVKHGQSDRHVADLRLAVEQNLVRRHWNNCMEK